MTKIVQGVVHGKTIQLDEDLGVPEGQQVEVQVRLVEASQEGIVDHVSFAVMRRLGITEAFTNDRHFRAAGFEPLF